MGEKYIKKNDTVRVEGIESRCEMNERSKAKIRDKKSDKKAQSGEKK